MRSRIAEFLQRRLIVIAVTVALLSLAALLARWHWLADVVSNFVPHYAFAAGFATVGLWWCGRPRWAAFAGLLCALQVAQLLLYFSSIQPAIAEAPTFKVMQFNVGTHHGTYSALPCWLEARATELDVVVLLEVDEGWRDPLEKLARHFPVSLLELRADPFGMALFARFPDAEARIEQLGTSRRPAGVIAVAGSGKRPPLKIIAGHPPPPIGARRWKARNAQYLALAEMAKSQEEEVVLVADLNSTPWSPFYGELLERTGLRDAQAGHGYRATWAPYGLPLIFGIPIDPLLISGGLVSLGREYPPRMSSDHRPIVTTLAVSLSHEQR